MTLPKCRILCVDDHHDSSEMLKLLLSEHDYEVVITNTMEEACKLAQSQEFNLYVIDRHLPDGSGLDLCTRLDSLTPGVPCIFYTGDAYELRKLEALQAGADSFVAKPDIDKLISEVHRLLTDQECATADA